MARSSSDSSSDKAEDSASSSKRDSDSTAKPSASKTPDAKGSSRSAKGSGATRSKADSAKAASSKADAAKGSGAKNDKASAAKVDKAKAELSKTPAKKIRDDERGRGFFGTIALFLRQVIAELKKVVTPTRSELFRYTGVVLVFVIIMMLFVGGLDLLFGWGASWAFGTGTEVQWPDFSVLFGNPTGTTDPAVPAE